MAEYTYQTSKTVTSSGLSGLERLYIAVSDINQAASDNIPKNAVVTKVTAYAEFKQGYSSSKGDANIFWSSSDSGVSEIEPWILEGNNNVPNSYTKISAEVTGDFVSSGTNVGQVNRTDAKRLYFEGFSAVIRKWYIRYPGITWEYYIPTYTLTVTAGEGGTVTGTPSGTYESGTSISITAVPNEGYRFVSWSDGDTNATKTGNLMWDASYAAIFEQIVESYYLDLNGLLDGVATGNISPYGTVDVYINGTLVAQGVTDYCTLHPTGTTYEIKNIKSNDGYQYEGVSTGSLTGTIGSERVYVQLKFSTKPLKFTSAELIYSDKQVSSTNKVPAGQSYIVKVGVEF